MLLKAHSVLAHVAHNNMLVHAHHFTQFEDVPNTTPGHTDFCKFGTPNGDACVTNMPVKDGDYMIYLGAEAFDGPGMKEDSVNLYTTNMPLMLCLAGMCPVRMSSPSFIKLSYQVILMKYVLTVHHKNADADFDNTTGKMNGRDT